MGDSSDGGVTGDLKLGVANGVLIDGPRQGAVA